MTVTTIGSGVMREPLMTVSVTPQCVCDFARLPCDTDIAYTCDFARLLCGTDIDLSQMKQLRRWKRRCSCCDTQDQSHPTLSCR